MMPGVQFEDVWKALYTGYTKKSLEQMLRTRLAIDLDDIVGDGPMKDMAFDLLGTAEREGWGIDLIREAYRYNPRNGELLKVYQKYGLSPEVSGQSAGVPDAGLEKTIKDRLPTFDFAVWREKMTLVEGRVCRIEIDGNAAGTGFLVGADAVMTNYHVLRSALLGTTAAAAVSCRFDYKVLADGSRVEGVSVGLAADWNLDSSPNSAAELTATPDTPPPTPEELDYALVRLARRLGDEPVTPKGGSRSSPARLVADPDRGPGLRGEDALDDRPAPGWQAAEAGRGHRVGHRRERGRQSGPVRNEYRSRVERVTGVRLRLELGRLAPPRRPGLRSPADLQPRGADRPHPRPDDENTRGRRGARMTPAPRSQPCRSPAPNSAN